MGRKKLGITIGKTRTTLYKTARMLGNVNAVASGKPERIFKRLGRIFAGKFLSRILGKIFR